MKLKCARGEPNHKQLHVPGRHGTREQLHVKVDQLNFQRKPGIHVTVWDGSANTPGFGTLSQNHIWDTNFWFLSKIITTQIEANSVYLISELSESKQARVGLGPDLGIIPKSKRLWAQDTKLTKKRSLKWVIRQRTENMKN